MEDGVLEDSLAVEGDNICEARKLVTNCMIGVDAELFLRPFSKGFKGFRTNSYWRKLRLFNNNSKSGFLNTL